MNDFRVPPTPALFSAHTYTYTTINPIFLLSYYLHLLLSLLSSIYRDRDILHPQQLLALSALVLAALRSLPASDLDSAPHADFPPFRTTDKAHRRSPPSAPSRPRKPFLYNTPTSRAVSLSLSRNVSCVTGPPKLSCTLNQHRELGLQYDCSVAPALAPLSPVSRRHPDTRTFRFRFTQNLALLHSLVSSCDHARIRSSSHSWRASLCVRNAPCTRRSRSSYRNSVDVRRRRTDRVVWARTDSGETYVVGYYSFSSLFEKPVCTLARESVSSRMLVAPDTVTPVSTTSPRLPLSPLLHNQASTAQRSAQLAIAQQ